VGHERRVYKAVFYNNLIIKSNNGEATSFSRMMDGIYPFENTYYYGYDFNNIIDQGRDYWMGSEFALFGEYEKANNPPSFENMKASHNYFYNPVKSNSDPEGIL